MMDDRQQQLTTSSQQRLAINITLITFLLMVVVAVVTLFMIGREDKTPIDNFMMPLLALSAGFSYYLTRRGSYIHGIMILLGTIVLAASVYAFVINNVGWQTAIGMLVIVTSISNGTMPDLFSRRITTGAFIFAIGIVFADLFLPGLTEFPVTTSSIIVTTILGFVYVGLILYRFNQYTLRTKFTIAFIFLSIVSGGAATITISTSTLAQLNERVRQQLTSVSSLTAASISAEMDKQADLLKTLASNRTLVAELVRSNLNSNSDLEVLKQLDEEWKAVPADNNFDANIRAVLETQSASELREFQSSFPEHLEVFITNRAGAIVAATNRTTDYYQADEEWWQAAYDNGRGKTYISQPIYDESTESLSFQIAVPVLRVGSNEIVGILRTTIALEVFTDALKTGRFGETGRTEIYLPDGTEMELHEEVDDEFEIEIEKAPQDFITALQISQPFYDTTHSGAPVLAVSTLLTREIEDEQEDIDAIQKLNWKIITMQDRVEALQIVTDALRNAQVVGLGVVLVATLLAVGMTQLLTIPISRLTKTAEEVSSGNLTVVAPVETADEIGTLAASFNRMTSQLYESLTNLEKRVAERTTDLEIARQQSEKRASQLLATGEISKVINNEQKLEALLPLVTRLVSERFGHYHTGIFLIDETRQYAVLQSANSPGGLNMLKRGHRLRVGESGIVGYVAKFGIPRIALDVGQDAVFFNNPDLPNTRSEMALPLIFRDETIGVLDVQSEKPGAFTDSDTNTLRILADQIAIAIENTRLFEQTQQALGEIQALYRRNLQEGWKSFSREEGLVGYRQGLGGGKKVAETVNSMEIQQAVNRGETLIFHADGKTNEPMMVVPIKLRGQAIGVINITAPSRDRLWTTNEINLSEAVSERLSLALENARLIQESQRQAIIEQTIGEITGKIGASINLENVLQTAVEELGRTIPGSEVVIKIKKDNVTQGNE